MKIEVKTLTTYTIEADGQSVSLNVMDAAGNPATVVMRIDELGTLAMTLPGLIEAALRRQYRDAELRYTYPMGSWKVEAASDPNSLIVTLRTSDGFGVSFAMPRTQAEQLGESIAYGSNATRPAAATAH
jgi:hypothetical protein